MSDDSSTTRRAALQALGLASAGALGLGGATARAREGGTETRTESSSQWAPGDVLGLVTVESDNSFETTTERIEADIDENENLTLLATVDHAENAEQADLDLRPTTLFIFGNPALGTPLMQASPTAAIDLPQKMLVFETEDETVTVAYNDPLYVAVRHGITDQHERLEKISSALRSLATGE